MYLVPGRSSSASLWRTGLEQADHTPTSGVKQQIFLFLLVISENSACRPTNEFWKAQVEINESIKCSHFPETRKSHAAIITSVLQQNKNKQENSLPAAYSNLINTFLKIPCSNNLNHDIVSPLMYAVSLLLWHCFQSVHIHKCYSAHTLHLMLEMLT